MNLRLWRAQADAHSITPSDEWDEHFRWRGATLHGKTPVGRTTVVVLNINPADVIPLRRALLADGVRF